MRHIAIVENLKGRSTDWTEKVSDAQYGAPVQAQEAPAGARPGATEGAQPTPAQRLMGDIAPKLAQLTDSVLFGDVWARPGLSRRGRSLVTVSALIEWALTGVGSLPANAVIRGTLTTASQQRAFTFTVRLDD